MSNVSRPRICIVYTGGTIGMRRFPNGSLRPPEKHEDFLRVAPELGELVDYDFYGILNKDSTNIAPPDWQIIANAIYAKRNDGFDGFVVAHGTDTMHYTASAVALALGSNLNFPVVFTGAQTIPEVHHGDARINLIRACQVASTDLAEVAISFGDFVFRGCRAQKKDERRFDAFQSPAYPPLAYITEEILLQTCADLKQDKPSEIELKPNFAENIFQVSLIPGLEPELLQPLLDSELCNGIILQSFGAGNVPNEAPFSLLSFIEKAREKDVPLIVTSQFPANATLHTAYEPGRQAVQAGAIPTGNMTSACAMAKFRWVIALVEQAIDSGDIPESSRLNKIDELMQTIFVGEMDR